MTKLEAIPGTDLSEYALQLLNKNKIFTAYDFLSTKDAILYKILQIGDEKLYALKTFVLNRYAPQPICLGKTYRSDKNLPTVFQTGIAQLDSLLAEAGDKFVSGCIWDICGLVGTGKTQLMHTIVANFASSYEGIVLFIDTHNGFSAVRIKQIIEGREPPGKINGTSAMQSIRVLTICTPEELLEIMEELVLGFSIAHEIWSKLKLVVIDSLPILWFDFQSDDERKTARIQRGILAKFMRQLMAHNGVSFLAGNLSLSDRELTDDAAEVSEESSANNQYPKDQPMLGISWSTVPRLRLTIETLPISEADEEDYGGDTFFRQIRILKSCFSATGGSCVVRITDTGVI